MNIGIKQGIVLKNVFTSLTDLCSDILLKVDHEGVSFQGMDASHISMSFLRMNKCDFDLFQVQNPVSLGLSVTNLNRILKLVQGKDQIIFHYDETSNPDILFVKIKQEQGEFVIKMKLMNIDVEDMEVPEMEFTHIIQMPSKQFARQITDLVDLGMDIQFQFENGDMSLGVTGDLGETKYTSKGTCQEQSPLSLRFSTLYLKRFIRAQSLTDTVTIQLLEGTPICLKYSFLTNSSLLFYLAPKIDDE